MHCSKYIIDDVIDKFGASVNLSDRIEDTFTAWFKVSPRGVKFWALQYLPYVEIVQPQWLRDEILESINANRYNLP